MFGWVSYLSVASECCFLSCYSPSERRKDDLDTIYEELTRIKALSHLSNSVKRELSGVMVFESHPKRDTVCK